jgi:hypothetical protein
MIRVLGVFGFLLAAFVSMTRQAAACDPEYEELVAWDAPSGVFVLARWWNVSARPAFPPNEFAFSTGERIECHRGYGFLSPHDAPRARACSWRDRMRDRAGADLRHGRAVPEGSVELRLSGQRTNAELLFEGHRVSWLRAGEETSVVAAWLSGETLWIHLRTDVEAPSCSDHREHLLRVPIGRASAALQGRLLATAGTAHASTIAHGFGLYRRAAELGRLPPDALLAAMRAAEAVRREDLAALWWRRTCRVGPGCEALEPELRGDSRLRRSRRLLDQ